MPVFESSRSTYITLVGRKGQGKSHMAARLWRTWPHDRLCVDPTGDADVGDPRADRITRLEDPLPIAWPSSVGEKGERVSLHYVPDMGSPTHWEDMDRAVGLAYHHGNAGRPVLVWIDEMGELMPNANKTGPNTRRMLHHGRHRLMSTLLCGPRPIDVNPLAISQADHVFVFDLPNPADCRRVADNIGWDPAEFEGHVHELGDKEYLHADIAEQTLAHYPKLPPRRSP